MTTCMFTISSYPVPHTSAEKRQKKPSPKQRYVDSKKTKKTKDEIHPKKPGSHKLIRCFFGWQTEDE